MTFISILFFFKILLFLYYMARAITTFPAPHLTLANRSFVIGWRLLIVHLFSNKQTNNQSSGLALLVFRRINMLVLSYLNSFVLATMGSKSC
jgi:hypothetical protein